MIQRAKEEGLTVQELAEKFIAEYFVDADGLGIRRADFHPKATEHIDDIIAFVQKLMDKGLAYQAGSDVYFDTGAYEGYGRLSGQNLEDLELGARIDINDKKKNPMDFVLWKGQKPGEPAWDSPWGPGRPGWHIECSVMATKYLGETIDIHSGGQDLIFPHHENEIAQSEGATGKPFARYWLHNGYINVDNRKCPSPWAIFYRQGYFKRFRSGSCPAVYAVFPLPESHKFQQGAAGTGPKCTGAPVQCQEQLGTSFEGCGRKAC